MDVKQPDDVDRDAVAASIGTPRSRSVTFGDKLRMSQGIAANANVTEILMREIPSAVSVTPAHSSNDRNGTDWWVECRGRSHLAVDAKVRERPWTGDLALETWSVVEFKKPGWTRDRNKRTDYIFWLWSDGRWCLVPFQLLLGAFEVKWESWSAKYKTAYQTTRSSTGSWQSQCVFVPVRDVWAEIYRRFSGAA